MERETTDKRTEKTKASILQALISLSKKKEINEISIRELTEAAHIHRNTFYLHYTDVYSVLSEIEENMCRDIKHMAEKYTPDELRDHVGDVTAEAFRYLYEQRESCILLLRARSMVSSGKNLLESIFERYLTAYPKSFDRNSLEFQVQFQYCTAGALGIVRYWFEQDFTQSPERMAALTGQLLIKGIQGSTQVS